jgi:lipid-A-disaccharide synthase
MFVIFPFEETFYQQRGVRAVFTGHPLADLPAPTVAREEYARAYGLDAAKPWIALLPGSRGKEVEANLPEMLQAARMLGDAYEFLLPVAPTLSEDFLAGFTGGTGVQLVRDARAALHHAHASVVASGTATVQAALLGNPFVVVYRVSALTFWLAKRLVRYPAEMGLTADEHGNLPIAMPNLIAGHRIVPELINRQMTAAGIVSGLLPLLADGPKRAAQMRDLAELCQRMAPADRRRAIDLLRDAVLESIGTASASSRV